MFSPLRNRFGIPGVISVVALVFAMLGGAYAASDNGGGKATSSAKAKRGPKGPKGATGPAGPAGPAGAVGPAGAQGPAGANGKDGAAGPTGPTGATGATGATGQTGFTETLPAGKTETGVWAFSAPAGSVQTSISFPIPLEAALDNTQVHLLNEAGMEVKKVVGITEQEIVTPTECLGTVAEPTAEPGNLCVYTRYKGADARMASNFIFPLSVFGLTPSGSNEGAGVSGARLQAFALATSEGYGTWAVTAEE